MATETPPNDVVPSLHNGHPMKGPAARMALEPDVILALRQAMVARRWRAADLARVAKISESVAGKLLAGRSVSPATIEAVANAIDDTRPNKATLRLLTGEIE